MVQVLNSLLHEALTFNWFYLLKSGHFLGILKSPVYRLKSLDSLFGNIFCFPLKFMFMKEAFRRSHSEVSFTLFYRIFCCGQSSKDSHTVYTYTGKLSWIGMISGPWGQLALPSLLSKKAESYLQSRLTTLKLPIVNNCWSVQPKLSLCVFLVRKFSHSWHRSNPCQGLNW